MFRYFYGGLLHSGAQARDSLVAPYAVMHVPGVTRMEGGNCSNEVGVVKIMELLRKMMGHRPSIGVITFYA